MKLATTANLPKKTLAKVNDPDSPAWTEDMLGAPVLKRRRRRGRGPQATPTKVLTSLRWMLTFWMSSRNKEQATSHGLTQRFAWKLSEI